LRTILRLFLPIAALSLLSGCIAAAIPLAAAGALGKSQIDRAREKAGLIKPSPKDTQAVVTVGNKTFADDILRTDDEADVAINLPGPNDDLQLADIVANPTIAGSGQGLDNIAGTYQRFLSLSLERNALWEDGQFDKSAVLVPRVSLVSPKTMACSGLPPAVIIDIDRGSSDKADPLPFKFTAPRLPAVLDRLREEEISVIWLSARPAAQALTIINELKAGDLLRDGGTDFVSLNRSADDRKQLRRWAAAEIYCILGTLGDARGDFDELYDYLLDPDYAVALERNFGNGWFLFDKTNAIGDAETIRSAGADFSGERSDFFNLKPSLNQDLVQNAAQNAGQNNLSTEALPLPDQKEDK
jgi:hypothetical protein